MLFSVSISTFLVGSPKKNTCKCLGSLTAFEYGLSAITFDRIAALITMILGVKPNPSVMQDAIWSRILFASDCVVSNITFPVWIYVRTFLYPDCESLYRNSFIGTILLPPTLMPRIRMIHVCIFGFMETPCHILAKMAK